MTAIAVRLAEWQTVSPDPGSPTEGVNLGDDPSVRDLARRLSETGMLEVLELRTGLSVRSTSFVGRVRLGEIEITVVPKLPSDALLTLLRYAYGLRNLRLLPATTAYDPGPRVPGHPGLAVGRGGPGTPGEGAEAGLRAAGGGPGVAPRPDRFPGDGRSEHPRRGDPAVRPPPPRRGPPDQPGPAGGPAAGTPR